MPPGRRNSPHRRYHRRSRSRSRSNDRRRRRSFESRRRRSRSGSHHRRSPHRRSPHRRPTSPHRKSASPRRKSPLRSFSPRRKSPLRQRSVSPRRKSPTSRRRSISPQQGRISSRDRNQESRRGHSSSPSHMVTSSQGGKEAREHSPFHRREHSPPRRQQFSPDTSLGYRGINQDVFNPVPDSASSRYLDPLSAIPPYNRRSPSPSYTGNQLGRISSINSLTILNTDVFRQLLNDRFRTPEQEIEGPFTFDDNITIGIHRAPNVRNLPPVPVIHDIDMNKFIMLHRIDEGITRLFDREEIKIFRHDENLDEDPDYYQERRTISIVPSKQQNFKYEDMRISQDVGFLQGFSSSKIRLNINDLDSYDAKDRRKVQGRDRRESDRDRRRHKEPTVRLDPKPDPRYEALFKAERELSRLEEGMEHIPRNPNDLRHNLLKRRFDDGDNVFDARKKIEAKRKTDERGHGLIRERARSDRRSRDRSPHQRSRGQDDHGRGRTKSDISDDQDRGRTKSDKSGLPDFSRRQDKYKYEEWKDNPELIPRNPSYFEHDNREGGASSSFLRGRGRGFRGSRPFRGGTGGSFRGRGRRLSPRPFRESRHSNRDTGGGGEWKHDLFDKLEKEEDEKPSSTTKN